MGYSLTPIKFFSDEIEMSEIISATSAKAFELEGHTIQDAIGEKMASLDKYDDFPGHYLLTLENGDFIEFTENRS